MTEFTSQAPSAGSVRDNMGPVKPAIALALATLADWLFYAEKIGISAVIFAIALTGGSVVANLAKLSMRRTLAAGILVAISLMPAIEEFNAASLAFLVLALGVGLLLATNHQRLDIGERAAALCDLFLTGPFRFFRDAIAAFKLPALAAGFAVWFVPVALTAIFLMLLVSANPLLEKWVKLMNPGDAASNLSIGRILFWAAAMSLVWPFIHVWWRSKPPVLPEKARASEPEKAPTTNKTGFFGAATILRSLILFNLLFAVQTILDLTYLWGNVALPADITYASYAHRGAYPLILTALLAAGFVLAAMRPGGPAEHSRIIRPLVYLWVAQNVLLVASSILRLDLYVQIYLLTWWRVAAFIWMLLVMFGLLLIVARIAMNRSNYWLIGANLITLAATFYVSSLVNFDAIIANYNVSHSREATGKGVSIDIDYLRRLGPQALPAINRAISLRGFDPTLVSIRGWLVEQQRKDMASWRSWGFRSWRLQRTLDARQDTTG